MPGYPSMYSCLTKNFMSSTLHTYVEPLPLLIHPQAERDIQEAKERARQGALKRKEAGKKDKKEMAVGRKRGRPPRKSTETSGSDTEDGTLTGAADDESGGEDGAPARSRRLGGRQSKPPNRMNV